MKDSRALRRAGAYGWPGSISRDRAIATKGLTSSYIDQHYIKGLRAIKQARQHSD